MKKTKYLHIAIIILGIIFITIPVFHNNLWFDESYSVGMAQQPKIKGLPSPLHGSPFLYWIKPQEILISHNYISSYPRMEPSGQTPD